MLLGTVGPSWMRTEGRGERGDPCGDHRELWLSFS